MEGSPRSLHQRYSRWREVPETDLIKEALLALLDPAKGPQEPQLALGRCQAHLDFTEVDLAGAIGQAVGEESAVTQPGGASSQWATSLLASGLALLRSVAPSCSSARATGLHTGRYLEAGRWICEHCLYKTPGTTFEWHQIPEARDFNSGVGDFAVVGGCRKCSRCR